jgi:hypothetical protein
MGLAFLFEVRFVAFPPLRRRANASQGWGALGLDLGSISPEFNHPCDEDPSPGPL